VIDLEHVTTHVRQDSVQSQAVRAYLFPSLISLASHEGPAGRYWCCTQCLARWAMGAAMHAVLSHCGCQSERAGPAIGINGGAFGLLLLLMPIHACNVWRLPHVESCSLPEIYWHLLCQVLPGG